MNRLNIAEAKQIDLVDYLATLGHHPQKVRGAEYWYLSPLRQERTASFKVDRQLNLWYDHGTGQGGSIIDFGMAYFSCGLAAFMERLEHGLSFHRRPSSAPLPPAGEKKKIRLLSEQVVGCPGLVRYVAERCIPLELARQHCREVRCELNGREFYALGFRNDLGGYELRNPRFKGSCSPKAPTFIRNGAAELSVFEGCFDFLSYLVIRAERSLPETSYLILNSLSAFEASLSLMQQFPRTTLYLDHDAAGRKLTGQALKENTSFRDGSGLYAGAKDLNEWHVGTTLSRRNAARIVREVRARSPGDPPAKDRRPGKKMRR